MIVSLLYKVTRKLSSAPGMLLRRDTAKDAELLVLRHENAVQRRQIAAPVRYEPTDRLWLAALAGLMPRHRWREVFPVASGTLLAGIVGSSRRSGTTALGEPGPGARRPERRSRN